VSLQPNLLPFTEDCFCVHGVPFRLKTNVPDARSCFGRLYGHFYKSGLTECEFQAELALSASGTFHWTLADRTGEASTLNATLWNLESILCETIIRSQRRNIAIHAGALAFGGSAALIAGRSGAGKSTLSVAMVRRGFTVGSDDVTLADPDSLHVFPVPRCFHLDDQSLALLRTDGLEIPLAPPRPPFIVPGDFMPGPIPACRARILILISGQRVTQPLLTPMPQAEMAARLLQETGLGPLSHGETMGVLSRLAAGARCYGLTLGPLGRTADAVAELIRESAGTAAEPQAAATNSR